MDDRQKILNACKESIITLGKVITPAVFYLPTPSFHYEIEDLFMNHTNIQVMVMAPRGFAKSSLSVLFILHHIIYEEGNKVIVIQSKTQPEAINRLTQIKDIFEYSAEFKELYGYAGRAVASQWTDKKIKTKLVKDGKVQCSITIKAIGTGMPARGQLESDEQLSTWRITLYFLDDADDEDNTLTPEQMLKNWDKFSGSKEGLDKRNGRVLVLGTFIRDGCIVDRLDGAIGWVTKKYEARWDDEDGHHLLWEEMRDDKWLDDKLAEYDYQQTPWKYWSEFHNKNTNEKDRCFQGWHEWDGEMFFQDDEAFLKIIEIDGRELPQPRIEPVNNFIGIDPASSEKQNADSSVTFPISYTLNREIFTQKYYNRRVKPTGHAEQIVEAVKQFKPKRGAVESTSYQEFLRQYLIMRMNEENIWLSGLEQKWLPRQEKSARLESLEPLINNGRFYVKKGSFELKEQMEQYPRNKRSPNLLDGLYFATRKLIIPSHKYEIKKEEPFMYPRKKQSVLTWMGRL